MLGEVRAGLGDGELMHEDFSEGERARVELVRARPAGVRVLRAAM